MTELIEVTHKPAWRANMQKLYHQAYDMGLVDMTSNWAPIVLCMKPFIDRASHYNVVRMPHSTFL